ncbi:MAG: ABC transporter permease [Chitinophagaceae bacterium]|nr:ABC transporter permease [Chitinophagaceae bacterium]
MIATFFKTTHRKLLKNKVFSLINIAGLAIGMVTCFLIFQYAHFERGYEKYNVNADNVYRIPLQYHTTSDDDFTEATNYPAVGPALKANFPEITSFARLIPATAMLATATISRIEHGVTKFSSNEKRAFFSDPAILRMFSVPMIYGNDSAALTQIRAIVISESDAKKYFGTEDPMNKTLFLNGSLPMTVTGVFKDIPENSHLKFDMLISFPDEKFQSDNWGWSGFYTYVMLSPGINPRTLENKFADFMERYSGSKTKQQNFKNQISLQPIKDIHLNSHYQKELEPNGNSRDIWFLSILSFFVLLIAYINYINLSTAKVMERASEVGLRKVIGASKFQLIWQFLMESFIVNCLAIVLAALIVWCLAPFYKDLIGKTVNSQFWTSGLLSEPKFWTALLLILTGGSFLVGIYPALLMSKYNPIDVLKGRFYSSQGGVKVRKILGTFQFVLSIILIAGSLIVFYQLTYMRNQYLGYNSDHMLVVKTPGIYEEKEYPKINRFQRALLQNASINGVGLSTAIPGESIGRGKSIGISGEALIRNAGVSVTQIDNYFLTAYHIPVSAGRNFEPRDSADVFPLDGVSFPGKVPVIVNESLVRKLDFKTNEAAVSKLITFSLGENELKGEIIGIIKDYHQTSLKDPIQPTLYIFPSRVEWKYFSISLNSNNLERTISFIQDTYKGLFAANPFDYFFQDDFFNEQYKSDRQFAKIFNVFTALSIFVSCLGLLGLLSFIIRIRNKEIGIRRVLGASVRSILFLFFTSFFRLIILATLFALPVIYYAGSKWLNNFAFHTQLNLFVFIFPPLILIVITFVTVTLQSLKTVLSNPVAFLRDE